MPRRSYRRAAAARSAPYVDYDGGGDDDDDGDDDGGEFVPGVDDVDELEGFVAEDDDDEYDDDDDLDQTPPALFKGHLSKNDQGRLLYQDDQRSFVFLSSKALPDSWSLENPLGRIELEWMHPPQHASRTTFELTITKKQEGRGDRSWEQTLLHVQEQEEDGEKDGKLPANASAKSGDDDAEDEKPKAHKPQPPPPENGASSLSPSDTKPEAASPEKSPASPTSTTKSPPSNLKAPPSYSLKQPPATDVKAMPKTTTTLPSDASSSDVVYGVLGRQITSEVTDGDVMAFQGVFHPPKDVTSTTKLFLICAVSYSTAGDSVGTTAAVAASPVAAAAPAKRAPPVTAVSVARKRSRHHPTFEEEEEEEEDADEGVEYSELIALHADNALSPEELRRKYYGGGGGDSGGRPSAAFRQKSVEDDDDDDDDDDVGF
jgi:hypothetical protein